MHSVLVKKNFLTTLQILGIKKNQIASLSPTPNAIADRSVGIVKNIIKENSYHISYL